MILLSPTECLIFSGSHNQAMSWDESLRYAHQLLGVHPWTGYMIEVVALQRTLKEARHEMQVAREFTHERTKQRIAHLNALATVPTAKAQPTMPQRSPRGCGMTRRADQFFMQQQLREMNFDELAFAHHPALLGTQLETPENERFDSACEDAKEDEGDATSMADAKFDASMGEETDATGCPGCTPSADRRRQRNRTLDGLDSLYGVSMTFQLLNAALCDLQQRPMESAHAYYNCMAQITVILRECHGNRYRPGELARMSKDCFYVGLLPENCPMVVHLKDQPHTTPLDLLRVLLEQEENNALTHTRYPPSTSTRPSHPQKSMECYHRQPATEKRNDGYTVRPAQRDATQAEAVPKVDAPIFNDTVDALESWYNNGFLISLWQAATISESRSGHCFNCQKEVHYWRQCKETLSPELQELSDQQDRE